VLAATWPFILGAVAIYAFIEGMSALYDLWNEIDWSDLGRSLWTGIVDGLEGGWEAVKSVFSDLADEAAKAFKTALGMASPSKVFAELGYQVPAGVAQGISGRHAARLSKLQRRTWCRPQLSTTRRSSVATRNRASTADAAIQRWRPHHNANATNVTIGELHVHAQTAEPKALAIAFRRELENVLEGLSLEIGAPPLGAT
jgi:hypothetical protein